MKARVRITRLVLIATALVSVIAHAAYTRDIERIAIANLIAIGRDPGGFLGDSPRY
jgi:hypothetical protein